MELADEAGVAGEILDLVNSGRLRNPTTLRSFLEALVVERRRGAPGKHNELREARIRADKGNDVSLGGSKHDPSKPLSGQADVVQYGEHPEAVQVKTVTSDQPRTVASNISKAVNQLKGKHEETPPTGAKKIIQIMIDNKNNSLYHATRDQLIGDLKPMIDNIEHGDGIEIRIRNGVGSFVIGSDEFAP